MLICREVWEFSDNANSRGQKGLIVAAPSIIIGTGTKVIYLCR